MKLKGRGQLIYEGVHRPILERFLLLAENQKPDTIDISVYRKLTNAFLIHLTGRLNAATRQVFEIEFNHIKRTSADGALDMWRTSVSDIDYFSVIDSYPALKILLDTLVQQELDNLILASRAFSQDYSRLLATSLLPDQGIARVTHIFVLSDESHDGGKNVVLFYVDGAPTLAFKPRNVQIEARTSEFIKAKVGQWIDDHDWIFPTYLTSETWGWSSWHVPRACSHPSEVSKYFFRVGVFSAFSAALGITDLNAENIIAGGASPVFVDLETVLHHELNRVAEGWGVLSTGIFPTSLRYWGSNELTESAGLVGTLQPPENVDGNRIPSPEKAYVFLGSKIQRPIDFSNEIADGFKAAALQISRNRPDLLAFIDECKNLCTRCILRPTAGYQTIIEQSFHPSLLLDNEKRSEYIARCLTYAKGDLGNPRLILAELSACIAGDVPRLLSTPTTTCVRSKYHVGAINLDDVLTGHGKSGAYVTALSNGTIESEKSSISEFMAQLRLLADPEVEPVIAGGDCTLNARMRELERRLIHLAKRSADSDVSMHTFRKVSHVGYTYEPIKIDLFSGLAALAYFVLACGTDTLSEGDQRTFSNGFARRVENATTSNQLVGGAYVGLCSAVLPLLSLQKTIEPDLFSFAIEKLQTKIATSTQVTECFLGADLVGGLSGALAVCTLAWKLTTDTRWLEMADGLYGTRIACSRSDGGVRYFPSAPGVSEHPFGSLSGLSHGQAGIAYALALYSSSSSKHCSAATDILLQAFQFEIRNYDPALNGWRDYRANIPHQLDFNFSWAYGVPGILLAGKAICDHYPCSEIQNFVDGLPFRSLVRTALAKQCDEADDSLSSGVFGTLAIAHRVLAGEEFRLLEDKVRDSKLLAAPQPDTLPGLMTGMTGRHLGIACIKGADWNQIPLLPHELCHHFEAAKALVS